MPRQPQTMRLFWAIQYPPTEGKKLIKWLHKQADLSSPSKIRGIRWLDPAFLHCTLHFMASFPVEAIPVMVEQVQSQVCLLPLKEGSGAFSGELGLWRLLPRPAKPRVLVLSLAPEEKLACLASMVQQTAERCLEEVGKASGLVETQFFDHKIDSTANQRTSYNKAFFAHLSVARGKPEALRQLYRGLAELPASLQVFTVNKLVLIASELQAQGAQYYVVATVPLESTVGDV
ncbi:2'-5' RNA ligase family protein [Zooshikella sp. RANM57]|uniref:2'-5' RNA ligase family protein n=1 Tax=Zooshikella sp. RANM57 TaxID=3425863 RepID=UPI003D6DB5D3